MVLVIQHHESSRLLLISMSFNNLCHMQLVELYVDCNCTRIRTCNVCWSAAVNQYQTTSDITAAAAMEYSIRQAECLFLRTHLFIFMKQLTHFNLAALELHNSPVFTRAWMILSQVTLGT